jgi:hypothetical protein
VFDLPNFFLVFASTQTNSSQRTIFRAPLSANIKRHPMMSINPKYLPLEPSREAIDAHCRLVSEIESSPPASVQAKELVERFNASVGKSYTELDFREYYGAVSLETFVKGALLPEPLVFEAISDADCIAIVEKLTGPGCDEAETTYWIRFLQVNLQCDDITDIIFWSDDNPDAAEIVARARERKRSTIITPPNSG